MQRKLPNALTVIRLAAAPCVALIFVVFARPLADWIALGLFVAAAATDWIDGFLARRWQYTSRFGAMLDPIADKAMILTTLTVVLALSSFEPLLVVPGAVIILREVFVSGLREFLGADAGRLKVTRLAKWKTSFQMIALACLLLSLALQEEHYWLYRSMAPTDYDAALARGWEDFNLIWQVVQGGWLTGIAGIGLIWVAGLLTAVTGWDYYRKARPFLQEDGE